jgi:hypothetical protein
VVLAHLPVEILTARFTSEKALAVNELVRTVHGDTLEWFDYILGNRRARIW